MDHKNLNTSSTLSREEELLAKNNRNVLLKLMSELSILDRDILVMKFLQDSSTDEIARTLGLGRHNVEKRIRHALQKWTGT